MNYGEHSISSPDVKSMKYVGDGKGRRCLQPNKYQLIFGLILCDVIKTHLARCIERIIRDRILANFSWFMCTIPSAHSSYLHFSHFSLQHFLSKYFWSLSVFLALLLLSLLLPKIFLAFATYKFLYQAHIWVGF